MYITVKQLANKINNLERFSPEELHIKTEKPLYKIDSLNEHGHITDYFYTDNDRPEERETMAKRFCKATGGTDYKVYRIK